MNVFELRDRLIADYSDFVRSFMAFQDKRIEAKVNTELSEGLLWPEPLIQLNPSFQPAETIDELVDSGVLQGKCSEIFRKGKSEGDEGKPLRLHTHQSEAIKTARAGHNYVLTTGTGSGKSLAYIVPIVDHVLRHGSGRGIQAIVVYPMNALANSQEGELKKFLCMGYPEGEEPVTFARYTGQESDDRKQEIVANPPDILLTNYVMLELILTRPHEKQLVQAAKGLRFLVLDELHTYRGRQGADVAMLVRRAREAFSADHLQCVGTSATLAGEGNYDEQRVEVARVTSMIFGDTVSPENVIGETLRRATSEPNMSESAYVSVLRERVGDADRATPEDYESFVNDPLSMWIESAFGVSNEPGTGRIVRATPRSISGKDGAARELSELTGVAVDRCAEALKKQLMASYYCEPEPDTGFPVFAFRLHQFVSRGDTVYASLEPEVERYLTVRGQQFVPGDRSRILFPLAFCRKCGQEYYCVRMRDDEVGGKRLDARDFSDQLSDDEGEAGFLYFSSEVPWPHAPEEVIEKLPDEWLEQHKGNLRVRKNRREYLPHDIRVAADGRENESGLDCHYIRAPFRFCLCCGISFDFHQKSDFAKLTSLGTEGRSTATTILSLAAIRHLKSDKTLAERARKLLSFTDNRQDASLQAGHFNDFIEVGLLRSALYKAASAAGPEGLRHDFLVQRVFDALDLSLELYASDPSVRFQALDDTKRALRSVLGYRLYRDLKRGWRVTTPNLEQCGLLEIRYLSLGNVCDAEDVWETCHPALSAASPETRMRLSKTLLDFMRRELAIKVDYLDSLAQERIKQQSSQRLKSPWEIDDSEKMTTNAVLYPRPRRPRDYGGDVFLSPRGGFGQYLRRVGTFPSHEERLSLRDAETVIRELLGAMRVAGIVEVVIEARDDNSVPGYQLLASALLWVAGDGTLPFHDPIRVPRPSEAGGHTNAFFIEFYKTIASDGKGLEAREHTAQVQYEQRIDREERFREAQLPILYCSPTMELGVDIAELNAVNLRNMPPTPANYAQRSGRAGRSGQPALVFAYCSSYSPHDQYFFRQPERMVRGSVTPPRIDLTNEDLIRAHIHAIWLAETDVWLGISLKDILDLSGEDPGLELLDRIRDDVSAQVPRRRARERACHVLDTIGGELEAADWYSAGWLDEVLAQVARQFDRACDRWRGLYRSAAAQRAIQHSLIADASRSLDERNKAKRLRAEAEAQIELLTEARNVIQADFYSYRYFASEGFLPGYNFPRLPLSAYIPGRRRRQGRDEFLSRPRFLAISEFGPRAIIYHEGSRYRINKVILPVEGRREEGDVVTGAVKQCAVCGYLHPISSGDGVDKCEHCGEGLDAPLRDLFRLQNVSTRRVEKINCDEEERLRLGYEIKTGYRFAEREGGVSSRVTKLSLDGKELATLTYGHAATLWRINLGWMRRKERGQQGFMLDVERGYWSRNQQDYDDVDDPLSDRKRRVIPYVEDRKNCLLLKPSDALDCSTLASLQAALKNAIQVEYELEDNELAAERLPSRDEPRLLLFYESAEGGAGVLRRLMDDPQGVSAVARQALSLCHYNPDTGEDLGHAPGMKEDCEAACYDCLMSYRNQRDHRILDRRNIKGFLSMLVKASMAASPTALPRAVHLEQLTRQCQSNLEKSWLEFLEEHDLRLPSRAQALFEACRTRPDFLYENAQTAIYVDGPHHDYPDRQERDKTQVSCMEDSGWTVIRFGYREDWQDIVRQHPNIFGEVS